MIASAPGKLILTGEYAVLEGAPALVVAVNRRAIARKRVDPHLRPHGTSPFLIAVADEIAARRGATDPATIAAMEIAVDSTQFFDGALKLGLGSSAAVTVAATALALGSADPDEVFAIASAAHARAQGPRGTRGSGADIAAAVRGGVIAYSSAGVERVAWPEGLTLISFFTERLRTHRNWSRGSRRPARPIRSRSRPRSWQSRVHPARHARPAR